MDPEILFDRIIDASISELFIRIAHIGKSWRTDIFFASAMEPARTGLVPDERYNFYHVRYSRERMFGQFYQESQIQRKKMTSSRGSIVEYLTQLVKQDQLLPNWANFWDSVSYDLIYKFDDSGKTRRIPLGNINALLNLAQCHGMLQFDCKQDTMRPWRVIFKRLEAILEGKVKKIKDSISVLSQMDDGD